MVCLSGVISFRDCKLPLPGRMRGDIEKRILGIASVRFASPVRSIASGSGSRDCLGEKRQESGSWIQMWLMLEYSSKRGKSLCNHGFPFVRSR